MGQRRYVAYDRLLGSEHWAEPVARVVGAELHGRYPFHHRNRVFRPVTVLERSGAALEGFRHTAAKAAEIEGRITGHSGRVGLATELTIRGASTADTMLAGGWSTSRTVARYAAGAKAQSLPQVGLDQGNFLTTALSRFWQSASCRSTISCFRWAAPRFGSVSQERRTL